MKVIVPDHYKEFKCIAGACEDTCCAGWEVDVDEDSYRFYKEAGGEIGKRLADVMIPKAEGDGCSFRLTPDKRCPFLNEKNLCDNIYEAQLKLGYDKRLFMITVPYVKWGRRPPALPPRRSWWKNRGRPDL